MMRVAVSLIVMVFAAVAHTAEPPRDDEKLATSLHDEAVQAVKNGELPLAVERWRAAEAVHSHWKYAFNLSSLHVHMGRHMEAWEAAQRARALDPPQNRLTKLAELERKAREQLLKTYALVQLEVLPADATVTLNGAVWKAPRARWLDQAESDLVITRRGYIEQTVLWEHAIGQTASLSVELVETPVEQPTVLVRPEPAPEPASESPQPESTPRFVSWKWAALASGVALVGTGAGLVAWSAQQASDWETEGASYTDVKTYNQEHAARQDRFNQTLTAGWALAGVGGAALTTAIVLFVLDGTESRATVAPMAVRGGGGLTSAVRF